MISHHLLGMLNSIYMTISTAGGEEKKSPSLLLQLCVQPLFLCWAVFSKKAKQCNPTIMFSMMTPNALKIYMIKTRMELCTAALFITAKILKKPGYPSTDECISKVGYIHVKVSRICYPKICLSGIRLFSLMKKKKPGISEN